MTSATLSYYGVLAPGGSASSDLIRDAPHVTVLDRNRMEGGPEWAVMENCDHRERIVTLIVPVKCAGFPPAERGC